jgi:hypothetical protein
MEGKLLDFAIVRGEFFPEVLFRTDGIEAQYTKGKELELASTAHG